MMINPIPYNPDDGSLIEITPTLALPRTEVQFRTSRSSGPGGQHVNKVETRVELLFDVANSPSLTDEQKMRIYDALSTRIDDSGVLHVTSERYRSQFKNREDAVERFAALLEHALRPRKSRQPTRVPRRAREARLQDKRQRSEIKQRRRGTDD
ncbi:MAG: alternative ribosome rescue aminoacyl-tRNA hydrolase ArfB [Armatimonadota bacterium]